MVFARSDDSPAREVIHRGVDRHFRFALSRKLETEIARKLITDFALPGGLVGQYLAQLRLAGDSFEDVTPDDSVWCRDANNLYVFVLARSATAWGIVTYDADFDGEAQKRSGVECWKPPRFLGLIRDVRGEPPGQRHTGSVAFK